VGQAVPQVAQVLQEQVVAQVLQEHQV
jgi:hypothetical protein